MECDPGKADGVTGRKRQCKTAGAHHGIEKIDVFLTDVGYNRWRERRKVIGIWPNKVSIEFLRLSD